MVVNISSVNRCRRITIREGLRQLEGQVPDVTIFRVGHHKERMGNQPGVIFRSDWE